MIFARTSFFPYNNILNTNQITDIISENYLNCRIKDNFDILDISSLNTLRKDSLIFINKKSKFKFPENLKLHVITDNIDIFKDLSFLNVHLVSNIDLAYSKLINFLFLHEDNINFYNQFKYDYNFSKSKNSIIDKSSIIGENCFIGRGVKIGKNCIIKNNVVLKNCILDDNVHIGDNTTIGSTGFGFNLKHLGSLDILPHIGIVYIDKNVRIGANCSIDRGKIDNTYIGKNSMLDNQIHIAHNVILGTNVCIAAQCGISGSTILGNNIIIGGQSGIAGHLNIGNNVVIAAKSGVTKNIKDNSIVAGFPAVDINEWKRSIIKNKKYGYKQN